MNHDETGTALLGWKIYDAGELSMMIVSVGFRPSCERSYKIMLSIQSLTIDISFITHLNIVALVIIAAFPKQAMCNNLVYIELI